MITSIRHQRRYVRFVLFAAMLGLATLSVFCVPAPLGFADGPHSSSPHHPWDDPCFMAFAVPTVDVRSFDVHVLGSDFVAVVSTEAVLSVEQSGSPAPLETRGPPEISSFSSLVQRSPPAVA